MSKLNKELLNDLGFSDDEDLEDVEIDDSVIDSDEEQDDQNDDDEENEDDNNSEEEQQIKQKQGNKNEKQNKNDLEFKKMQLAVKQNLSEKEKQKMMEKVQDFNKKQQQKEILFNILLYNKGVCYLSRIPPYMKATLVRKLLEHYGIERVYLAAEDERKRKFRVKNGGNKRRCYTEGWVEFTDKRVAKRVALSLNCTKMVQKTRSFYGEDLWNIKYLPKFKWENLTERLAYQNRVRKEKLQNELAISKKEQDFYKQQLEQSKKIQAVEKRKSDKNQTKAENIARRTFLQRAPTKKIHNAQSDQDSGEE